MSITDPESLKNFWSAIFRRNGADGAYTRLFDDLNAVQQSELLMRGTLRDTELPVIGSFEDANNWLMLTTERLIWSVGRELERQGTDSAGLDFLRCESRTPTDEARGASACGGTRWPGRYRDVTKTHILLLRGALPRWSPLD